MPVTTRLRRLATVATAVAAALIMSATSASATTQYAALCADGVVRLTVVDGAGTDRVRVTQVVNADGDSEPLIGVRRGFTWLNERTGATGSVGIGNDTPATNVWSRDWTVITGTGNVVVTWNWVANTNSCLRTGTLRAQAYAR